MVDNNGKDNLDDDIYSSSGLKENTAAVLTYLGLFFAGIFFVVFEKDSEFVKFHAIQSTLLFFPMIVVMMILNNVPGGPPFNIVIAAIAVVLWIFLMFKAYKKEFYKLPLIGNIAEKYA